MTIGQEEQSTAAGVSPESTAWRALVWILALALGATALLAMTGIDVWVSMKSVAVVGMEAATGATWWAMARRNHHPSFLELVGMGAALGTATSMLSAAVLWPTTLRPVAWALPALGTGLWLVIRSVLRRARPHRDLDRSPRTLRLGDKAEVAGWLIGLAGGLVALAVNWRRSPLSWSEAAPTMHPDMLFFEALQGSVVHFGPGDSIFAVGTGVRYHWFTFLWAGDVARVAGIEAFGSITRVLPVISLIGVAALASSWARRLSTNAWVPALSALLVVVAGYLGAGFGAILNFDSPSQALTALWMLGAAILVVAFLVGEVSWAWTVIVASMAAALMGGKVSQAVILVAGTGTAGLAVLRWDRRWWPRAVVAGLAVVVGVAVAYVLVIAGITTEGNLAVGGLSNRASALQGLDPGVGGLGVAAGTFTLLVAALARNAGLGWLLADRQTRQRPEAWFALGAVGAGAVALLVVSQGVNDLWFILAASGPGAVLSAVGVGIALDRAMRGADPGRSRWVMPACVVAGLAVAAAVMLAPGLIGKPAGGFMGVWAGVMGALLAGALISALVTGRLRWPGVLAAATAVVVLSSIFARGSSLATLPPSDSAPDAPATSADAMGDSMDPRARATALAASEEAAAAWIQQHTDRASIGATNLVDTPLVPALTQRRLYVAAIPNLDGLGSPADLPEIFRRGDLSLGLADGLTQKEASTLCQSGVEWVWLETADPMKLDQQALYLPAWHSGALTILLRADGGCDATDAEDSGP